MIACVMGCGVVPLEAERFPDIAAQPCPREATVLLVLPSVGVELLMCKPCLGTVTDQFTVETGIVAPLEVRAVVSDG